MTTSTVQLKKKRIKGPSLMEFFKGSSQYPAFFFHELMQKYGDIVSCRPFFYLINNPDLAKQILNRDQKDFEQTDFISQRTRVVFGKGLVINNGESWATQRRILSPLFSSKSIHRLLSQVEDEIDRFLDNWNGLAKTSERFDIGNEMGSLALIIAGKIFFNTDLSSEKDRIKLIVEETTGYMAQSHPFYIPYWIPTPLHIKLRKIQAQVDTILNSIINLNLKFEDSNNNLVGTLLDKLGKPKLTKKNRRIILDEMKTMMAGGYFPTSCTITFFWYTMSENPKYFERVKREIRSIPDEYKFTSNFYKDFPLTNNGILESMRLYPAAFSIWRKSKKNGFIGDYYVPKGKDICISLFNTNRNPKIWKNPDDFYPDRFNEEYSRSRPKHCFIPFGWGNRKCIGDHYAMLVIYLTVIKCIRRFDISITEGQKLKVKKLAIMCPEKVESQIRYH